VTAVWILKHWRESLLSLLLVWALLERQGRQAALREVATSVQSALLAQALHRASGQRLAVAHARVDTLIKVVTRRVTDTLALTDTVYLPGDTVARLAIPLPQVLATNAQLKTCGELAASCEQFRTEAVQRFALDSVIIASIKPRACHPGKWAVTTGILGAAAGYAAGRR
jgi:hypothetical protein